MSLIYLSLEQGLIYAILAMGLYITFNILKIADMTTEGSFPLGALVSAGLILKGVNPVLVSLIAFFIGIIPGVFSAYLSSKIKIMPLLSGILTMTMLYSINLRINGKSNIVFSKENNIFSLINVGNEDISRIVLLFIIVFIIKFIIDLFLKTKAGYMLLVTGDNESLVKSLGQNPDKYKYIGLGLANGLIALSGSLFAQSVKFADLQMGIGVIVIALASVIIGDSVFKKLNIKGTSRAILGAVIYKLIGALALEVGLEANDLKLINALIVIVFIAYNNYYGKIVSVIGKKYRE
ncbi:ABC transporter permease [Peptoniphilaceae bacterium SGI.131]